MNEAQGRSEGQHPLDTHLKGKLDATKLLMKVQVAKVQHSLTHVEQATAMDKTPTDLGKALVEFGHATSELGSLLADWDYTLDAMELRKAEGN